MNQYSYDGPVMEFERCIASRWQARTLAISEKKARCNLAYRFKQEHGRTANARITLPGKIVLIPDQEE